MISHAGERVVGMESPRQPEPYHRQVPGSPRIIVRNGFLDQEPIDGGALKAALMRTKSAPAKLGFEVDCCDGFDIDGGGAHFNSLFGDRPEKLASDPLLEQPMPEDRRLGILDQCEERCGEFSITMTIESPNVLAGNTNTTMAAYDDKYFGSSGGMQDNWMLPESAWPEPFEERCGEAPLARQASPSWDLHSSQTVVAGTTLSPTIGSSSPQAAVAPVVQIPVSWMQQVPWQLQSSQTPSSVASPGSSQQASPLMSPLISPPQSPLMSPKLFPDAMPIFCEADACLQDVFSKASPCAHTIQRAISPVTGVHRILWTVDAGKLRSHERQAVSPSFELPLDRPVVSRLVIFPRPNSDGKGSASFKKSGGWGSVHLKCEASRGIISFQISTTNGTATFQRQPRGPIKHDFADHSTCGLPKDLEQWDFNQALNIGNQTFAVCLDLLPNIGS